MSRGPSTFRQRDVKAATKAVLDAGCEVARVVIDMDGRIIVDTIQNKNPDSALRENEWDTAP